MKEIGGYFEFELRFEGEVFHKNAISLNLARNAVLYLAQAKKYKKLYIPFFLCDCISRLLENNHIDFEYYHVDRECRPVFEKELTQGEAILIVNYYGQLTSGEILSYKKKWNSIILDNTQTFFETPIEGIDTIYNARKYFGIADGGYLYTDVLLENEMEQGYSYSSMEHLVGRYEKNGNSFYQKFREHEERMDRESLKKMSLFSENILRGVNYNMVLSKRTHNFSFLHEKLTAFNNWKIHTVSGAYMYPFLCEDGDWIRRQLVEKNIYIPTLWPNVQAEGEEFREECNLAKNILPLPVDQRYDLSDMERMCKNILELL